MSQVELALATEKFAGLGQSSSDMSLIWACTGLIQNTVKTWCCKEPSSTSFHASLDIFWSYKFVHCLQTSLVIVMGIIKRD